MKTIKIYGSTVDDKTLHSVVDILKDGGIVVYPTDTLYAIGCDALNNNAINKICKLKGINPDKQFSFNCVRQYLYGCRVCKI